MDIGPAELLVILLIVALLFGPGRIANLGGELGKGIHEFRRGLKQGVDESVATRTENPIGAEPITSTKSND